MTLLERLRAEEDSIRGHADLLADVADRLREITKELERLARHGPVAPLVVWTDPFGLDSPSSASEDRR